MIVIYTPLATEAAKIKQSAGEYAKAESSLPAFSFDIYALMG